MMSTQNKKTLSVVFILMVFVLAAVVFSQGKDTSTISMREYVDMQIVGLKEFTDMKFAEFQKAVEKAYLTNEIDKQKMNEIRGALSDANKMFATTETVKKMENDIRELRSIADVAKGAATQGQFFISMIASFIGMFGGIFGVMLNWKKFSNNKK